ncbi:MAG: DUF58 domain-containing protein [Acidimicrobiia bacterium]|nr:DUF58 domain-containing protein [Acidimicrobiia bacterium]
MPTTRGWVVTIIGLILVVAWVGLGTIELGLAGMALILLVLVSMGMVAISGAVIDTTRQISPAEVHDGQIAYVTTRLHNPGRRHVRGIKSTESVADVGNARFDIATIAPGSAVNTRYRITCSPRGELTLGAPEITLSDRMELARRGCNGARSEDSIIVLPAVERLDHIPRGSGVDLGTTRTRPEPYLKGAEDFSALREYRSGDDLRRVHWPSTARFDEIMIRQMETPRETRGLILLDVRPASYEDDDAFERAVSGAASALTSLVKAGYLSDLWAGGTDTVDGSHIDLAMERLALVSRAKVGLLGLQENLRHRGGGLLVIVTGVADTELLALHAGLAPDYPTAVVLCAANSTPSALAAFHRRGVATAVAGPDESWVPEWDRMVNQSWQVPTRSNAAGKGG